MNAELDDGLRKWGADVDGALNRFLHNETMYVAFLNKFVAGPEMPALKAALRQPVPKSEAQDIAHTLKGVAGNLGLNPLYKLYMKINDSIKNSDFSGIDSMYASAEEQFISLCKLLETAGNKTSEAMP
jgi:HPt (histidine-containing phosphotransfer) domain-containing protein